MDDIIFLTVAMDFFILKKIIKGQKNFFNERARPKRGYLGAVWGWRHGIAYLGALETLYLKHGLEVFPLDQETHA